MSTASAEQFFLAPHKNQTVALRVTSELVELLKSADGDPERMTPNYRRAWEAGQAGNKYLIPKLQECLKQGITEVEGTLAEHVEATERIDVDGRRVMVISSEQELGIEWRPPSPEWGTDCLLNPADVVLEPVQLAVA